MTLIHCGSNAPIIKMFTTLILIIVKKRKNYEEPFIVFIFVVWDDIEQINLATVYNKSFRE